MPDHSFLVPCRLSGALLEPVAPLIVARDLGGAGPSSGEAAATVTAVLEAAGGGAEEPEVEAPAGASSKSERQSCCG